MVRAMLAACLTLLLASCTLATPIFTENFTGCSRQGSKDIPGFEIDYAVISDMSCDNSKFKTGPYSAKILPINGQSGTMAKTLTNLQMDNREITISFWLHLTNNVPYPTTTGYSIVSTWSRISPAGPPFALLQPITISRDTTVDAVDGWYKYVGRFTPTAPASAQSATITVSFTFTRPLVPSWLSSVWMDDAEFDYTPSAVIGDPQFVGLRGQSYQVHGIDGAVYNLVSSSTTQVNSRFVFLDQGKCPIFDGIPARNCWAHAGSYLGEIGIQQVVDGFTHKLAIIAGSSVDGFASVKLDGNDLLLGDQFVDTESFSVKYMSSHSITVQTAEFTFTFDNSDKFINQAVSATKPLSQLTSHGLFGQTHKRAVYSNAFKYIAGDVDDYIVAENELFGEQFMYNKFHANK